MFRKFAFLLFATALISPLSPARAASSISIAQNKVDQLRTLAAEKYEAANEMKIKIGQLQREEARLKENGNLTKFKRDQAKNALAKIAIERYKGNGLGQGFALLFSDNPTKFLSDSSTVEMIGRRYATSVRTFETYEQRLKASRLVVADKTYQVREQQRRLNSEVSSAKLALTRAEKILASLKSGDRNRLLKAERAREQKILENSKKVARNFVPDSSRGAISLKFALEQIGDIYLWGGAGPTRWDCSGLTLRAFARAGVSLPHSAAIQFNYGKSVSYKSLKPGDLVFYGKPISHVAIYIGGGKMVQAPRAGKKVEVVSFTLKFGYKPFMGAKRL